MFKFKKVLKKAPKPSAVRVSEDDLVASLAKKVSAYNIRKAAEVNRGVLQRPADFGDSSGLNTNGIVVETIEPKDVENDASVSVFYDHGADYFTETLIEARRGNIGNPTKTREEAIWARENK